MQRSFWGAAALALLAAFAAAQDSIKLENGTRVTGDIIALSPPLVIERSHVDELLGRLGEVIRAAA